MSDRRPVLVFRQELLKYSETFIPAQTRWLERYEAYFTGLTSVQGLELPPERKLVLDNSRAAKGYKLLGIAPEFVARLRALRPALVHAHFEDGGIYALPLARALNIPMVTTFHGYDATMDDAKVHPNALVRSLYLARRRRLQRNGALFIAVSEFIKGKLIARGYPEDRIVTHNIGVDTDRFSPDADQAPGQTVLFVGRLVEKKGCEYLIRAMAPILTQRPDVRLVIIGDGPQRAALQELQRDLGVWGIEFRGAVDSSVIQRELGRACLLAAPSVTAESGDSEGLPIAICEAQAMGVPVAGYLHAGIPEVVKHGVTGLLAQERSVEGLRFAISKILDNGSLRNSLGKAARERAVALFSLQRQTAMLEKIYDSVAETGGYAGDRKHGSEQQNVSATVASAAETVVTGV